jgi:CCR4-NOT transcriptional regulation complex NOT5 subunit
VYVAAVEIDRTLKRIDEGILEFDAVYERVGGAETQAQKEKFEEELKKGACHPLALRRVVDGGVD